MRYVALAMLASLMVIAPAGAAGMKGGSLHATLTGRAEVPKGDPDGRGTAEIKLAGNQVCWEIKTAGVARIASAHIHRGAVGVAGPVVVPLGKTFRPKGCITSTAATVAAIRRSPAAFYVNVHNARYPAGALRGQLRSDD